MGEGLIVGADDRAVVILHFHPQICRTVVVPLVVDVVVVVLDVVVTLASGAADGTRLGTGGGGGGRRIETGHAVPVPVGG